MSRPDHKPHQPRRSIRMDAGLDTQTRETIEELATAFHCSRAAVLRQVMRWGLGRDSEGPIPISPPSPGKSFFFMVDAELHQQIRAAAKAAGVDVAPWVRHMVRQMRKADFPKSWEARKTERQKATAPRSHDSRHYGKRFMMRLDAPAWARLEELASHFDASNAAIIRQPIIQAKIDDFPPSWHVAEQEYQQESNG
jgi:predicted HicB family RNase H-like nuclease/predicted transcriptional regulator